jgi:hypothetical protein
MHWCVWLLLPVYQVVEGMESVTATHRKERPQQPRNVGVQWIYIVQAMNTVIEPQY